MSTIQRIKHSTFLRHNAVFFVGSVGVGVLNYLYYPILGRLLDPAPFGEVQTLVSLFLQFTVFLQVLNMIVVNVVVNYKDTAQTNRVVFELEKVAVLVAAALVVASMLFGPILQRALQFESAAPFVALALALLVSVPLAFRSGFVRAKQRFGAVSIAQGIGAGAKIVLSAILVVLGLGTLGAIIGLAAAQLIALAYAAAWASRVGFSRPKIAHYIRKLDMRSLAPELKYAAAVLGGSLSVMLLLSIDMLAVKYYFDPETAGLYAGITTVARAIFFFTASIALVLLPAVKLSNPAAQNRGLLLKSLALLGMVGGTGLAVCILAPQQIISVLMGQTYAEHAGLLPWLAGAMLLISVANLIVAYFLALRRKTVALVAIIGFVSTIAALLVHHDSLRAVVDSVLLGSIVTMCLLGLYIISNLRLGRRTIERHDQAATRADYSDLQ